MEVRVWCENGDLVAHATVSYVADDDVWMVESHPFSTDEKTPDTIWGTREAAHVAAMNHAERWRREAINDYFERHGDYPVGIMSETGFTIQEVEDE